MAKEPRKTDEELQRELDRELDAELEDTFPASDPPQVTRIPARSQYTGDPDEDENKTE
ncbi:hypothetical protein [Microvirga pudoricolor]|uniref:hypothetical protein n=1 Tax=Microvirga pudoricolor TaxID=2778729 RepID=UPI00194FA8C8|nr:hypothetical protein [Microvirga pudoricolor]MBM6595697.1 hypothetical protein [Microvirga pudoricolor]